MAAQRSVLSTAAPIAALVLLSLLPALALAGSQDTLLAADGLPPEPSFAEVRRSEDGAAARQRREQAQLEAKQSAGNANYQCPQFADAFWSQVAATAGVPESQKVVALPESISVKWARVNVTTLEGPSDFGWVESAGKAMARAVINDRSCALLSVRASDGSLFDKGPDQRAFFSAILRSGPVILAGSVEYLPSRSMHYLCYTPPTPGVYRLELRLGFTNALSARACSDPVSAGGFAKYVPVLETWVKVTGLQAPGGFNFTAWRLSLPLCTVEGLSTGTGEGFWMRNTWYPQACRLTRLSQKSMLLCLSGKRVLLQGDSQLRLMYGVMQLYLNSTSRSQFLKYIKSYPNDLGDFLATLNISATTTGNGTGPPRDASTGQALKVEYPFLGGTTTFYGGVRQGFSVREVHLQVPLAPGVHLPVQFTLTYSSLVSIADAFFDEWKLNGTLTGGAKVTDGGAPIDLALLANQIHDVWGFATPQEYIQRLRDGFLPALQPILESPQGLVVFGGLSPYEGRRLDIVYRSNKARFMAFEDATNEFLRSQGAGSLFRMHYITSPRPDLAYDAIHYRWPVQLAMLDLWLGSNCPVSGEAT